MESQPYGSRAWFDQMFSSAALGYDQWGHQWRASQRFRHRLTLEMIRDRLLHSPAETILDIGCGLGISWP